jgi:hypothetical protein
LDDGKQELSMVYAAKTRVPIENTRNEIERTLARYGADRFAYFTEPSKALIVFEIQDRRVRFDLPLPEGSTERAQRDKRSRWRALLLCIKAKLESVESKIETFEEAFLAHVVLPDGQTVYQHTAPRLDAIAKGGELGPLLPPPSKSNRKDTGV